MGKKLFVIVAISAVLIGGAGYAGWWYYATRAPKEEQAQTKAGAMTLDVDEGNNGATSQASRPSPDAKEGVVITDPAKFGTYDSYRDSKEVRFADLKAGTGEEVTAKSTVYVNYRGWLTNGKLFDQNVSSSEPFRFAVAGGGVINGFAQGVLGMKAGGERLVIIPPELGYGALGYASIPANAVLVFHLKVVRIETTTE